MRSIISYILLTVVQSLIALQRNIETLRKEGADTYCQVFESELLSYSNFIKPNVLKTLNDRNSLIDGDSAWVSGFVTFSLPIVYRGCYMHRLYEKTVVFDPVELESKDIYSCIVKFL